MSVHKRNAISRRSRGEVSGGNNHKISTCFTDGLQISPDHDLQLAAPVGSRAPARFPFAPASGDRLNPGASRILSQIFTGLAILTPPYIPLGFFPQLLSLQLNCQPGYARYHNGLRNSIRCFLHPVRPWHPDPEGPPFGFWFRRKALLGLPCAGGHRDHRWYAGRAVDHMGIDLCTDFSRQPAALLRAPRSSPRALSSLPPSPSMSLMRLPSMLRRPSTTLSSP
jgi:hypothetical protein